MQMLTWNSRNKDMDNITNILTTPSPSSQRRRPEKKRASIKTTGYKENHQTKEKHPSHIYESREIIINNKGISIAYAFNGSSHHKPENVRRIL